MEEKGMLINSMQKLIKHISSSQKNQEQIFKSLSKNDLRKIVSNLEDQNSQLRKVSFKLLTELLYDNNILKKKFCQLMSIPVIPGKIVVNSKLISSLRNQIIPEFFKIIKDAVLQSESSCNINQQKPLFWFIQLQDKNLKVQTVKRQQNNKNPLQYDIDPAKCIFGITICDSNRYFTANYTNKIQLKTQKSTQEQENQPIQIKFEAVNSKPSSVKEKTFHHLNQRKSNPIKNYALASPKPNISKISDSVQVRVRTYEPQNIQFLYEDCCNVVNINKTSVESSTKSQYYNTPNITNKRSPNRYNKISTTAGNQMSSFGDSFDLHKLPRHSTDFDNGKRNQKSSKLSNMSNSVKFGGLKLISGASKNKDSMSKYDQCKPRVTNISFHSKTNLNNSSIQSPANRVSSNSIRNRKTVGAGILRTNTNTRQSKQFQQKKMTISYQQISKPHIILGRGNLSTKNQQKSNQKYNSGSKLSESFRNQGYNKIKNK